jgi:xanthine dehydrogenase accessory factor
MKRVTLDAIRAARRSRQEIALVTDLASGDQHFTDATFDRSQIEMADAVMSFVHVFRPTLRLIVVGAVHIAQKLVPLARLADFAVSVIDPRESFASSGRFPDVGLAHAWPDRAVTDLAPDSATAVVTLSHDPKLDDPALISALRSPAFYIGALGSRKTHARRLDRLREAGFADADLARIHAPVGLSIAAVSPGEIAVSIMAEIIATRHGRVLKTVDS